MVIVERERTSADIVMYALYLYFLGLVSGNTARAFRTISRKKSSSNMGMGTEVCMIPWKL